MRRCELPYLAKTKIAPGADDTFLIGGTARLSIFARVVVQENQLTGETDVPHVQITVPLAEFADVELSVLEQIAAGERDERNQLG